MRESTLKYNELKVIGITKWGNYLRKQWRDHFAIHLSTEEQYSIGMDRFLWHLYSWDKIECLKEEAAKAAFEKKTKQNVIFIINL